MAIYGQRIFVTWYDYKYGSSGGTNGDILGRLSTDGGETWGEEIRLTYNQKGHISYPVVFGSRLNVIWEDLRYRQAPDHMVELSHSYSYDDGVTWSPTELITPGPEKSIEPLAKIDRNSGNIHLAYIEDLGHENTVLHTTGSDFTGIDEEYSLNLPESPAILLNYPNPFNSSTAIRYQIADDSNVRLSIYNLLGEKVTDLVNEKQPAGEHEMTWDASEYSSGVYFYRLAAGEKYSPGA